jgi:hypothetical protein
MVHPDARGRGLGPTLLDRICGAAQIAFLATHPDAPVDASTAEPVRVDSAGRPTDVTCRQCGKRSSVFFKVMPSGEPAGQKCEARRLAIEHAHPPQEPPAAGSQSELDAGGVNDYAIAGVHGTEHLRVTVGLDLRVSELDRHELELIEQPVSGRNLAEMAYVRSRLPVPLLANEASWTRYDQLEVIRLGAADVLSVDNQMDGGLLNLKRGAGICEVAGLPVLKHSLGELGVGVYAAVHVMASTPNFTYANQSYASLLADDVIAGADALPYEEGQLAVPTGPGLGVELDRDKVARYARLYEEQGASFAFHDPRATAVTPLIPKR